MRKVKIKRQILTKNYLQKFKFFLGVLIGIIALSYLSFNDYGIVRHFEIKKKVEQIQTQIDTLEIQQDQIQDTIKKLQSDYDFIEKMARENMKMVKNGEELYIIRKNTNETNNRKK